MTMRSKKKRNFVQYMPATKNSRANMKFKSWMSQYSLYAIGEVQSGESRGALSREMDLKKTALGASINHVDIGVIQMSILLSLP